MRIWSSRSLRNSKGHYGFLRVPFEIRFWEKVDKTSGHGPNGDCWIWIGRTQKNNGYGAIWKDDRYTMAHRASWELNKGPIPQGLKILHRCDNPPCVCPDHLFLGTMQDNSDDMKAKGRRVNARGERCGGAKLTSEKVLEIRKMLISGMRGINIARAVGVKKAAISAIKHRRTWGWLA